MNWQPLIVIKGAAAHLARSNVDTDTIIRIERLTSLRRNEMGPYALEVLRFRSDGSEDPDFVFNQPAFRGAPILLAEANFGCGSSREAAVWALQGMGIRCIIAPSFGDIFFSNCFQNGLLPIRLPASEMLELAASCVDGAPLNVDLEQCVITMQSGQTVNFAVDVQRREGLLKGLDDIGLTLKDEELIRAWQQADRLRRPWAWAVETQVFPAVYRTRAILALAPISSSKV